MNKSCKCDFDKNYSKWEKNKYFCVFHLQPHGYCPYCICSQCEDAKIAFLSRLRSPSFCNHVKCIQDDPQISHSLKLLCASDNERSNLNLHWVTVSFDDKPVELIVQATTALFTMKFIDRYEYVYEQRGKTVDDIHGIHIHALIWSDNPTWKVKQWIAQKLMSPKYGVIASNKFIDAKKCPIEYLEDKRAYMTGTKDGDDKQAKQLIDTKFREKFKLEKIYKNT